MNLVLFLFTELINIFSCLFCVCMCVTVNVRVIFFCLYEIMINHFIFFSSSSCGFLSLCECLCVYRKQFSFPVELK